MQKASAANTASTNTLTNLTYIDTLVSSASAQGMYFIMVEQKYITNPMIITLESLGYTVSINPSSNPDFAPYTITW